MRRLPTLAASCRGGQTGRRPFGQGNERSSGSPQVLHAHDVPTALQAARACGSDEADREWLDGINKPERDKGHPADAMARWLLDLTAAQDSSRVAT